ncbi:ABC transporter ATP-binding protein [Roseibium algae]|uniref:ABC transporter ATP-binding protein n=1 Tax=Roseibium algae TaxID=3123038 RepID=A0ABU8TP61_9HYPH
MVSLQLNAVCAGYGRTPILTDISTPIFKGGQVVALIGPNAAGKSTLFRRIAGVMKGAGEVLVTGASSPQAVCYMPQDTGANPVLSVYESIILARMQGRALKVKGDDLAKVDEVVDLLKLESISHHNIGDLSGGQRQLVSAAQALVRNPDILLMDEPTSALDLNRQIELLRIVRALAVEKKMLILIALHDINHAMRFAESVMVLSGGRLRASGPTSDVITPNLLREVYSIDARIEHCSKGIPQVIVDDVADQP